MAGTGPVGCGREPNESPITRAAGDEGTGSRGESLMRLPTATLKEIEDDRLLHTETCWADVTDLSEESVLEAGRNI